jgi:hypothetical protein
MNAWPDYVASFRGESNSEEVLHKKGSLTSSFVASQLDAAEMAEAQTNDEQDRMVEVEEAALWYRILDELAFRFIPDQRNLFVDYLQDGLAFHLALLGSQPDTIGKLMSLRSQEYARYREWVPKENEGFADTLLWEAAKHVGEPIGLHEHGVFLAQYSMRFFKKLDLGAIQELLVG